MTHTCGCCGKEYDSVEAKVKAMKNNLETHDDMPKLHSPFKRKENENGDFVVYPEKTEGLEWVFENEDVMAVEKMDGTNVSIVIEDGEITDVYNRTSRVPPFNKGKDYITKGILNSVNRGYTDLEDGQHFGELIGPKVQGNPHEVDNHLWLPFERYAQKHLEYKSWKNPEYGKSFDDLSNWFKNGLFSLFQCNWQGIPPREASVSDGTFCEGIIFVHPDGRLAKLRRDMFSWYDGDRH